jgi:hypothetical protein
MDVLLVWFLGAERCDTRTFRRFTGTARLAARLDMPAVQARRCAGCEAVSVWGGGQLKRVIDNYLAYPLGRAMMEIDVWLLHCRYAWWCEAFGTLMALMRWTKKDLARNEP